MYLRVGLTDGLRRVGVAQSRPVLALNPRAAYRELLAAEGLYADLYRTQFDTGSTPSVNGVADLAAFEGASQPLR